MADTQGGGRARGRGRARAKPPGGQTQEPPRGPGGHQAGPPARPPGGPQATRSAAGPPPGMAPPAQQPSSSGRATHRGVGRPMDEATMTQKFSQVSIGSGSGSGSAGGNGNGGNGGAPIGRGNMRGKRVIPFTTLTTRPETLTSKKGASGQKVLLQANYYSLVAQTDWCLYQYRVDFKPDIDLTLERKKLLRLQKGNIGGEYIFDGTVLYCSHRIPADPMIGYSPREIDDSSVEVTIKLVGQMQVGDSHYLQFFNILTRKCLTMLNLKMMNRDYFDPCAKVSVPEYFLELWPGYKTTIRQHDHSVLLCAEITHKVMRTDTCNHLLEQLARASPTHFKDDFTRAVVGSIVLTDYNNRTYTISDVNWDETPASKFDRNGTQVSYIQYYKERYNITIHSKNQPLLVSKSKPRDRRAKELQAKEEVGDNVNLVLLIPELCRLTGITDEMRANFKLMQQMATHTRIGPGDRRERLAKMNSRLNNEPRVQQEFKNWNMKLSDKLVDVPARVLPTEMMVLGNNVQVPAGDDCDWTRSLRSNPMFVMPQGGLQYWVVLYPNRVGHDVESFVSTLKQASKGMRFNVAEPEYVEMPDDRNHTYMDKLDYIISNYNPQLIFVVLMSNKADRYSAIKKKSLCDRAVPTQVLLARNLKSKGVMSIATKVAIQMNCKIGGAPWSIINPLSGLMVVGFDVCHDSKSKGASYGAMVASLNRAMSRYFSAVSHHKTGEELFNDLASNVVKALHCYRKHNNTLPSHIMIYRDGVGDGQIPYVFQHEVQFINRAIKDLYGTQTPKLGFVIVCKQINTRLFLGKTNPPPGTVVDDVVTLPERYDFFIVSQHVNQGTVSPTSYNVIHDQLGLDPDKIQRLTYKLTHMYYNWSGTVRVPAPVQYAHKLAFLVSQSLGKAPNPALEDLLFFL